MQRLIPWRLLHYLPFIFFPACHLAPIHDAHEVAPPHTTRAGIPVTECANDLRRVQWWKKMHDPTLNRLIATALVNNNQIKAAAANVIQAQAKLKESKLAWLPTFNLSGNGFTGGGWNTQFTPENRLIPTLARLGLTAQNPTIRFNGYYMGFVPKYSLNLLKNIYNDQFSAASLDMQRAMYQSTRLSVIGQVAGTYFLLIGQKEQLKAQKKLVQDLRRVRRLESARYQAGESDLSARLNLDQQIATNEASIPGLENSIAQAENALQVLLNRNPGTIITHKHLHAFSVKGLIPAKIPAAVLKNRPDIMTATENLKMSKANIGLAYSNFFPTIPLTGLLGASSIELIHLLKLSTGLWLIDLGGSMPILDGPHYQQIKESQAGYDATYYSYVQTLKSAFSDVNNSLTNQQHVNHAYTDQIKALAAVKRNYRLAKIRYTAGAKDERDVANAQIDIDNARLSVIVAKMQQLDGIVGVYQSLGGGYG